MSRRFRLLGFLLLTIAIAAGGMVWGVMTGSYLPGDPEDIEQVQLGKAVYGRDCARCHGDDLGGELAWLKEEDGGDLSDSEIELVIQNIEGAAPAHDGSGMTWRHSDEKIFSIIKDGPALALAKKDSRMPSFGERLEDQEIWAVVAYLKSNWQDTHETID